MSLELYETRLWKELHYEFTKSMKLEQFILPFISNKINIFWNLYMF